MQVIDLGTLTAVANTATVPLPLNHPNTGWTVIGYGTIGTSTSWKVQVSVDGTNWVDEGAANTTVKSVNATTKAPFVRVSVTAGTGLNLKFALIV